jgi:hypothetical protein
MAEINPAEVSAILKQQLANFDTQANVEEVGTVLTIGDGIARVYGLDKVQYGELVKFNSGVEGIVLNLEEDNVGVALLGESKLVKEGDTVKRTNRISSIKVGEGMLGRVVDTLGNPIDGKGPIAGELYEMPLERKAPGVMFRQLVNEPLQTGIVAIDSMIPVGRGQEQFDEEEARKLHKKIAKNEFGFDDFLKQINQIKKMGNMKDLMGMIPGVGKAMKDVDIQDDAFKHIEAMIHSMTPEERRRPSIINTQRKNRIARGAGRKIEDLNALMKQFEQMGKMMKMMQGPQGKQMMEMMSKGMPKMPGGGGNLFGK